MLAPPDGGVAGGPLPPASEHPAPQPSAAAVDAQSPTGEEGEDDETRPHGPSDADFLEPPAPPPQNGVDAAYIRQEFSKLPAAQLYPALAEEAVESWGENAAGFRGLAEPPTHV